ncbi:MAG: hypothetical protein Q7T82_02105 [Armatimonadota bacterium]|nr:hypothetical protein [Armatimonadota bacterium]
MKTAYLIAPPGWTPESPNPFTTDGSYGSEWSCFHLRDEDDSNIINGRPGGEFCAPVPENADESVLEKRRGTGPYCFLPGRGVLASEARYAELLAAELVRGHRVYMPLPLGADRDAFIGRRFTSIETRLADFLRYESSHGRKVIVSFPPDMDSDAIARNALASTPENRTVRPDDPRWWVHSTPLESWEKIKDCGELRSFARMRREKGSPMGIGLFVFGEPADYAEYVMLAWTLAIGPEHVVSSQQKGHLITEEDTPYTPGVRMYFDGHRIIRNGLAVSDGLHLLKVRDRLPLDPYLVMAVSVKDVDPRGDVEVWTPWTFLNRANEYFAARAVGFPAA